MVGDRGEQAPVDALALVPLGRLAELTALEDQLLARVRPLVGEQGAEPGTRTQAEFSAFVNAEIDKWAKVISSANVKLE